MHSAYVKKLEELKNQLEKTEKESLDLLAATELLEKTTIRQASKLKQQQRDREIKIPGSMPGTRPISPAGSTGSNESKGRKINTHNYQNFIENLSKSTVIFIFNNSIINIVLQEGNLNATTDSTNNGVVKKKKKPQNLNTSKDGSGKINSPPPRTPQSYSAMYSEHLKARFAQLYKNYFFLLKLQI